VLAILTRDDHVSASLNQLGEEQRQQRFARQSALFKNLPLEAFQRLHFEATTFAAGHTVFAKAMSAIVCI